MAYNLEIVEYSLERRAAIPALGKDEMEGRS